MQSLTCETLLQGIQMFYLLIDANKKIKIELSESFL